MNEANVALDDDREQIDQTLNVRPPSEPRIKLAGSKRTVAGTIENRSELIFVEKSSQPAVVLRVTGNDALARKRPIVLLTDGDDLTRIARAKVMDRIKPRHTGDASNK